MADQVLILALTALSPIGSVYIFNRGFTIAADTFDLLSRQRGIRVRFVEVAPKWVFRDGGQAFLDDSRIKIIRDIFRLLAKWTRLPGQN